jgi:hypothetical protein
MSVRNCGKCKEERGKRRERREERKRVNGVVSRYTMVSCSIHLPKDLHRVPIHLERGSYGWSYCGLFVGYETTEKVVQLAP